jgi:small subunit ribosomal protein S20
LASSLSAKKRIRQNVKRRGRNRWRKEQIKEAVKAFEQAVTAGDAATAAEQLKLCYKKLDQTAAKGTIHKNAASRRKASLARRLSSLA